MFFCCTYEFQFIFLHIKAAFSFFSGFTLSWASFSGEIKSKYKQQIWTAQFWYWTLLDFSPLYFITISDSLLLITYFYIEYHIVQGYAKLVLLYTDCLAWEKCWVQVWNVCNCPKFCKKGKRREYFKLRNHDCVSLLFHAVFLVGGEQHLESQPAFRIDL